MQGFCNSLFNSTSSEFVVSISGTNSSILGLKGGVEGVLEFNRTFFGGSAGFNSSDSLDTGGNLSIYIINLWLKRSSARYTYKELDSSKNTLSWLLKLDDWAKVCIECLVIKRFWLDVWLLWDALPKISIYAMTVNWLIDWFKLILIS